MLGQWKMKTEIVILLQNAPPASGSIFYVMRDPCWCIGLYFACSRVQIHVFCEDSNPALNTLCKRRHRRENAEKNLNPGVFLLVNIFRASINLGGFLLFSKNPQ